jgi:type VI secretion system protein ImpF
MSMSLSRNPPPRVRLPLLDRLIDDEPEQSSDLPLSSSNALLLLRRSVRRDLEALLNARRRWRSLPAHLTELRTSSIGYGIPDFSAGALNDPVQRENLRAEIETTIRRFEPRFAALSVSAVQGDDPLEPRLRLRIEALLHAEPTRETITLDTLVDTSTAEVMVRVLGERTTVERVDV